MKILHVISSHFLVGISLGQSLQSRVLVVKNINSPASIEIADDYLLRRGVSNLLTISCQNSALSTGDEYMDYTDFINSIVTPLTTYLSSHSEIDFIVLTKGIPLHVYNFPNKPYGGLGCIDSYISAIGYEGNSTTSVVNISDINYGTDYVGNAFINKYYESDEPFSHAVFGGYLVSRLDGYTVADAINLTTRSLEAELNIGTSNSGEILLDASPVFGFPTNPTQPFSLLPVSYVPGETLTITQESPFGEFNTDMQVANDDLLSRSILTEFNTDINFIGNRSNLNGYYSWGSNDPNYLQVNYNSLLFAPGAIAETCVSTGGRTFLPTVGGQSLIADLVSQGVTAVKGYTDEPLLQAIASPSILFNRYSRGYTMAESFYAASRLVGWMDVVVGDPICRAYAPENASINQNSFETIAVHSLPSSEQIQLVNCINCNFNILDQSGKTVLTVNHYVENSKINVAFLEGGFYYIHGTGDQFFNLRFLKY